MNTSPQTLSWWVSKVLWGLVISVATLLSLWAGHVETKLSQLEEMKVTVKAIDVKVDILLQNQGIYPYSINNPAVRPNTKK